MNATEQTVVEGSTNQTPLLTFDGVNFCLLWALVLSVSWVVVFKEFSDVVRNADSRDISSCGVVGGGGQHIEKSHDDCESFVEESKFQYYQSRVHNGLKRIHFFQRILSWKVTCLPAMTRH